MCVSLGTGAWPLKYVLQEMPVLVPRVNDKDSMLSGAKVFALD